ncbi:hypothetical protein, partial [Streptomyces albidoflavus]|uniref:hypothetical protein n=1 Tax=Streptomyces albidoflavus TaxID=1886 RepID=UPI0033302BC5
MAFADQVALAKDETFRARVRMAAVSAAIQVAGEAQDTLQAPAYIKRQQLATRVLTTAGHGERGEVLEMLVWAVAQNVAISAASSDGDIQFTVNSVWS